MFGTQTYTNSFNFAPTGAELMINAFQRIQVRPSEILTSQIQQATMELNLLLAKMSNQQPNLWSVDLQALPLIQGQASYSLPAETVMITDAFVRTGTGTSTNDRMIFPISRTEYAAISNKNVQAFPNQYWFDRLISPTITLYQVPDGNGPYTLYYFRVSQVQDALMTNGINVDVPYLWLDAIAAGLAHRLARLYAPQFEQIREADAEKAWAIAATQNTENVGLYITPGIGGYYS